MNSCRRWTKPIIKLLSIKSFSSNSDSLCKITNPQALPSVISRATRKSDYICYAWYRFYTSIYSAQQLEKQWEVSVCNTDSKYWVEAYEIINI